MLQLKNIFLLSLLIGGLSAQAQNRLLKGNVVSSQGPVAGASVSVAGGNAGTASDDRGNFSLQVPSGNFTLVISYVGFMEVMRNVKAGENNITINLGANIHNSELDQVVVTAFGITRQSRSIPYATQKVSAKTLTEVRDPNNILNSLQGKVAGALITQSSGGVGSGARIVLRGNRSIQGTNSALIVIDGVPIYNETFNNMANSLNPDDIESVTVLRGASAAALYGSQAGNGVLVITTKKGAKEKLSVNVASNIVTESPFALPSSQNSYGQGNAGVLDPATGLNWGPAFDGRTYKNHLGEDRIYTAHPDNLKDFFRNGLTLNNSVSVSGGSEKAQTYLSYSNNSIKGIIPSNDLKRHIVNFRITNQIGSRITTDAKVTYIKQHIYNIPRSSEGNTPMMDIIQISRNISLDDAKRYQRINELGVPVPTPWPSGDMSLYGNPYWVVNHDINEEYKDQLLGFISGKLKITNWLNVTGRANLDRSIYKREQRISNNTIAYALDNGGAYNETDLTTTQKWFDAILEGNHKIGTDFTVRYNLGAIYQDVQVSGITKNSGGLTKTNMFSLAYARSLNVSTPSYSRVQTQSAFGQFNIGYKNMLFLDGSLRNDWDSRLPAPHSFQYYSAGISGVLSDIVKLPPAISLLKLGANYAEVGNGGSFGLIIPTYTYATGVGQGTLRRSTTLPMNTLKPEIVRNIEINLEASFLQNRFGFMFTYYKSNSFNQLLQIPVPFATGYQSRYINAGDIQNSGIELVLNSTNVRTNDFTWESAFNLGINRNKVLELSDKLQVINLGSVIGWGAIPRVAVGGSYGDMVGHKWVRNAKGQLVVNEDGTPYSTITSRELSSHLGNFNPKAILGLSNSFNYKAFNLRVLIDGRVGGIVVDAVEQNMSHTGLTAATAKFREGGWHLGGVDKNGSPVAATINAQQFWQSVSGKRENGVGEFFTYDATNFRLRELALGYQVPVQKLIGSNVIKGASIAAVFRNLFWIYRGKSILDIPGLGKRTMTLDPDLVSGNGNNMGVYYGTFPSTRSSGATLTLNF